MSPSDILTVSSISKSFARTSSDKRRMLRHHVYESLLGRNLPRKKRGDSEFQALNNVSFELRRGESVGLLGLNGAGKSTLLKIISGQVLPDAGEVRVAGHLESMIELSAGLLPSASGLENIVRRAGLLGRSGSDRDKLIAQVADFAALGDVLDSPVSTYSSGMRARLGFGIAVFSEPDLLLIDEVLAVGDFKFRQKCLRKINELKQRASFVMVSHSVNDISRFCERVLVLEAGELIFDGQAGQGIDFYHERYAAEDSAMVKVAAELTSDEEEPDVEAYPAFTQPIFHNAELVEQPEFTLNSPTSEGEIAEDIVRMTASFRTSIAHSRLHVGVPVWRDDGLLMTGYSSDLDGVAIEPDEEGRVRVALDIDLSHYNPGEYHVVIAIHEGNEFLSRFYVGKFTVKERLAGYWGVASLPHRWHAD